MVLLSSLKTAEGVVEDNGSGVETVVRSWDDSTGIPSVRREQCEGGQRLNALVYIVICPRVYIFPKAGV